MVPVLLTVLSVLVGLMAVYVLQDIVLSVLYWLLCVVCAALGMYMGASLALGGKQYKPVLDRARPRAFHVLHKMAENRRTYVPPKPGVMTSLNLDAAIQEVLTFIVRDYISSWYDDLAKDPRVVQRIEYDIWQVIGKLADRLSQVDLVRLVTQDAALRVTQHFQDIRFAADRPKSGPSPKFLLLPWLASEEKELQFLRRVTEVLMVELLPETYNRCTLSRQLVREIVACKILKPAVDMLCDPDYINQQLFSYLDWKEKLADESGRTYKFAASYEDFIQMIQQLDDIEHLKQVRYTIISEIMQATTINNLKKAQGAEVDKDSPPRSANKGDLLKARNLKRYINQLTVCKSLVEKRIRLLGGADYKTYGEDTDTDRTGTEAKLPGNKVLSFSVIMDNPITRDYFVRFLKRGDNHSLMGFWLAVENMKRSEKSRRYKLAGDIFEMFINSPSSVVKLDRSLLREMEAFMRGDKGPEAFYEAQKVIYRVLEKDHYTSFIVSDIYHVCISSMGSGELEDAVRSDLADEYVVGSSRKATVSSTDASFRDVQAYHAAQKLALIDERLHNKLQAHEAISQTAKADPKRQKLVVEMEKEIELLRRDKMDLEFHVERTSVWCDNVGKWTASIQSHEIVRDDDDEEVPYFNVLVHLPNVEEISHIHMVHGWVVSRSLQHFTQLQTQLQQLSPWVRKRELPVLSKFRLGVIKQSFMDKATTTLETFLVDVLKDDQLAQSEAVYLFLNPSADFIFKPCNGGDQKKRFSLAKLFKTLPNKDQDDSDDELLFFDDESFYDQVTNLVNNAQMAESATARLTQMKSFALDFYRGRDDSARDSVAEPLYGLVREVFELKGVFKWLRRTLIVFVQVTFGRTINRQLRATVDWMFSEPMLIYYIHVFRDAWWPGGALAEEPAPRSEQQKLRTRMMAKAKVVSYVTELTKNMIGENNAKHGATKTFEALQETRLNRNLFYGLFEMCLLEIVPELKKCSDITTS